MKKAKENVKKVSRADLKAWVDEKYPGKWENFIEILEQ